MNKAYVIIAAIAVVLCLTFTVLLCTVFEGNALCGGAVIACLAIFVFCLVRTMFHK
ncbi:MAG: hypothetical protein KBS74_05505 [Clostridiales bacterium]|nr:hypothetical protein [Candidatus Cacconaster stercorequi]